MKPVALALFGVALLLAVGGVRDTAGQTSRSAPPCPIDVVGLWRAEDASGAPRLLEFGDEGWATLHGILSESDAGGLEVVAQVRYVMTTDKGSTRVAFSTTRGNDLIPKGTTTWRVTSPETHVLTTRNVGTGEQIRWDRVLTERHFVTFVSVGGREAFAGSVFVMLTTLDGRPTTTQALGLSASRDERGGADQGSADQGRATGRFGRIPEVLTHRFAREGDPDTDIVLRLELTPPEYRRINRLFEAIERQRAPLGLAADPYVRTSELLISVVASVNQCGAVLTAGDSALRPSEPPAHLVQMLKAANAKLHLPDDRFPFLWAPAPIN